MSQSQPKKSEIEVQEAGCIARRPFLRAVGGAATAAVIGGAGVRQSSQEAEAIAPVVWGGAVGGSIAVGWALREFEIVGSDAPPEGLTGDALATEAFQTHLTRKSTNASSILANEDLLNAIEQPAYADGKIAGIEALNDQQSEADVQAATMDAIDSYETTVKNNFLSTWNESLYELQQIHELIKEHEDLTTDQYLGLATDHPDFQGIDKWLVEDSETYGDGGTTDITLPDGTDFVVNDTYLAWRGTGNADLTGSPLGFSRNIGPNGEHPGKWSLIVDPAGHDRIELFDPGKWEDAYATIEQVFDDVRDGLSLWVDTVYTEVQSGEIDVSELITPRERAQMMADEETIAPAIADLIALNLNVDPEREATIELVDQGVTLRGTFARTRNPDGEPLESGQTYDSDTDLTGDVYFSYDVSQGEGVWSDYEIGVDGGTVTFTTEPPDSVEFFIETTAGETATVESSEFTDEGDGTFTVDISEQVEDSITEIESVEMFPLTTETQFETVLLEETFEILSFEDSDGNEVDSASFEQSSEPQDDTNYITQEEWDDLAARNEELIEKYEEAQSSGGLFGGGGFLEGTNSTILIVVAAGLAAVGLLNN